MRIKVFAILIVAVLLTSCGSKRKAARKAAEDSKSEKIYDVKTHKNPPTELYKPKTTKTYSDPKLAYIDRYSDIAMQEMRTYKIPASITLAQGILESRSGQSGLTTRSNNHFGIKCHKGWTGKSTLHDDDEDDECFRVYDHPEESFRDHSLFLAERTRYADLFKLKITDYKGWAKGLRKAGYATDRKYPEKLINIIETYKLYQYDDKVVGKKRRRNKKNKVEVETESPKHHVVSKGDTLYSISRKYGLTVDKIKSINGLDNNTISIGQKLFLSY